MSRLRKGGYILSSYYEDMTISNITLALFKTQDFINPFIIQNDFLNSGKKRLRFFQ